MQMWKVLEIGKPQREKDIRFGVKLNLKFRNYLKSLKC